MSTRKSALGGACGLLLLSAAIAGAQPSGRLTAEQIAEAVEVGSAGGAEAYPLRSISPESKSSVGIVLTPFVRVALHARQARVQGRKITPAALPPSVIEPAVTIAMWDASRSPANPMILSPQGGYAIEVLPEYSTALIGSTTAVHPIWLTQGFDALVAFGIRPDAQDGAVAGFPLNVLEPGKVVVLYRKRGDPTGRRHLVASWGLIGKDDLARWR